MESTDNAYKVMHRIDTLETMTLDSIRTFYIPEPVRVRHRFKNKQKSPGYFWQFHHDDQSISFDKLYCIHDWYLIEEPTLVNKRSATQVKRINELALCPRYTSYQSLFGKIKNVENIDWEDVGISQLSINIDKNNYIRFLHKLYKNFRRKHQTIEVCGEKAAKFFRTSMLDLLDEGFYQKNQISNGKRFSVLDLADYIWERDNSYGLEPDERRYSKSLCWYQAKNKKEKYNDESAMIWSGIFIKKIVKDFILFDTNTTDQLEKTMGKYWGIDYESLKKPY